MRDYQEVQGNFEHNGAVYYLILVMILHVYSTYVKTYSVYIICQLHPNKAVKKLTEKSPLLHLNHLPKDFSVK